jgi:hypothetical protein
LSRSDSVSTSYLLTVTVCGVLDLKRIKKKKVVPKLARLSEIDWRFFTPLLVMPRAYVKECAKDLSACDAFTKRCNF